MEQTTTSAFITSIVAVVLGGLGLIGGLIGYVQGSAALRRASLTRQRATAAEESALQARTQAEQSARTAQEALDRIERLGVRSLGDVADQPTGPLILPPRVGFPPATYPTTGPLATPPSPEAETVRPEPGGDESAESDGSVARGSVARKGGSPSAPTSDPAEEDAATRAGDAIEPAREPVAIEPAQEPLALEPAPQPAAVEAGPTTAADPAPQDDPDAPGPEGDPVPEATEEAPPEVETAELRSEPAARSSTGQIVAGAQDAPPMDWAEALRTGAIPLPSRSRGTYAAPTKRSRRSGTGPARFEIRAVGRQRYEAVNVGAEQALEVEVEGVEEDRHLVRPFETKPIAVAPEGSLAFSVLRVEGRTIAVAVSWQRDGEAVRQELVVP